MTTSTDEDALMPVPLVDVDLALKLPDEVKIAIMTTMWSRVAKTWAEWEEGWHKPYGNHQRIVVLGRFDRMTATLRSIGLRQVNQRVDQEEFGMCTRSGMINNGYYTEAMRSERQYRKVFAGYVALALVMNDAKLGSADPIL